ncbi:MAG: radical SAM protein [Bacteroidales bacterium]|nr:radical SAM protein [Bacteroidales bacterium]
MEFITAKSILSPLKNGPDPYFGIMYSMNIYRGCQHQCIYCDSRSTVYNIGELSHIRIKQNALELLEQKLRKLKIKGTIGTGSMNDPYMPVEEEHKMVEKALQIIARYKFPLHIITKSNLVLRDAEIIKCISNVYAAVSFTITTIDDSVSKLIEPIAPVTSHRLVAMRALSNMGIYTGAVVTPVLPYITDSPENIKAIVQAVAKAGGKYVLFWPGLTQREGQREYFYKKLDLLFPGLKEKYIALFGDKYNCPVPGSDNLFKTYTDACLTTGLKTRMEHYRPAPFPIQPTLF